jgi:hypothetical protein
VLGEKRKALRELISQFYEPLWQFRLKEIVENYMSSTKIGALRLAVKKFDKLGFFKAVFKFVRLMVSILALLNKLYELFNKFTDKT